MKLPASSIVIYSVIYSTLFFLSIILHFIINPFVSSPLGRIFIIDFYVTLILFLIGNFIFSSNNIYDLHWPIIPFVCSIYYHFSSNTIDFLSCKRLPLIIIVGIWSFHLILQTISSSNDIHHEDWRYQIMRKQYEKHFLLFAFFALHLLPMFEVLIGSASIYYIYVNTDTYDNSLTSIDIILLSVILAGVLLENIADRQLAEFRSYKQKSREHRFAVLSAGLWKYSRHPNYLGELIFWWGLSLFGYVYGAPLWCFLGPVCITGMMMFGSIPMMEERLFRKYPDYKFVQRRISMLIPTFGLFQ